jgi:cation diffusion facilitator CzcD-associated flavoprotein CzcO
MRPEKSRSSIVIIGAGPYGLAAAAHLQRVGLEPLVFGETMSFWERHMPAGMYLRSAWAASQIADAKGPLSLDAYAEATNTPIPAPVPLRSFISYGHWFQRQVLPDVDRRRVMSVKSDDSRFALELEDGEVLTAARVIVSTGIASFAWRPRRFETLPPELASHSSDHTDLASFARRRVVVLGGGQSALESAALLSEAGAEVEVVARATRLHFLRGGRLRRRLGPLRSILYPDHDVGPPGLSLLVGSPALFARFPRRLQDRMARRAIRPAGADWLPGRIGGVRFTTGRTITEATPSDDALRLRLDDGGTREADHLLLATGYRVDVSRYTFLASSFVNTLRCVNGYPVLGPGLESSVPGLHFVGAPAAWSFGPLMRFVSGTWYSGRVLARFLSGRPR